MPRTPILSWIEDQLKALAHDLLPPTPRVAAISDHLEVEECGVGMELECDDDCVWHVAAVRPGGAAAACGVAAGDMLRAVDWMHVKGKGAFEVQRLIYGLKGTAVTLELVAGEDGASHHVTVIRANDYSPNTFEALDTDAREHDQDSWLSEKTCCHWNRCSAPRTPGKYNRSTTGATPF